MKPQALLKLNKKSYKWCFPFTQINLKVWYRLKDFLFPNEQKVLDNYFNM